MMGGLLKRLFYKQRAQKVADFYDNWSEKFLTITDTFQGFRTENIEEIHKYTIKSASLTDSEVILDAGCGVGGPAFYLAKNLKAQVYALTNSKAQIRIISSRKERDGVKNVIPVLGDYHALSKEFRPDFFTRILFLESLGHSYNPEKSLRESYHVLRNGGILYIRDLFKIKADSPNVLKEINKLTIRSNEAFVYNHLPVDLFLKLLESIGFRIDHCGTPNLIFKSIDEEFENKLGIPSTRGPIAFVEPLEIRAMKN